MKYSGQLAHVLALLVACGAIFGCAPAETPVGNGSERGSAEGPGPTSIAANTRDDVTQDNVTQDDPAPITVEVADRADYEQVLAKHKGKVVLVDFWATWCIPCVQQFPHTVELSKKFDPAQLAVVSVSMDEPEQKESVLKFLQKTGATFDNLISEYGVGQEGFETFEITDGAVPHYKVYDRTGKLHYTSSSNDELDEVVQQLVSES